MKGQNLVNFLQNFIHNHRSANRSSTVLIFFLKQKFPNIFLLISNVEKFSSMQWSPKLKIDPRLHQCKIL